MSEYVDALPHGPFEELFPDVFFLTGTMRAEFFGSMWQFSRNMQVVREGDRLTIINSVRLDDEGFAALESLGRVENLVRLGDMHGTDDPYFIDRYQPTFWALPGMDIQEGLTVDRELSVDGELPVAGASLFVFETTKLPESILRLDRDGGIMIACDSLQNWEEPDRFFIDETVETMRGMGFFTRAGLGLAWIHESEPKAADFARLKAVPFEHALCGHGSPLIGNAQAQYHATIARMFEV